MKKQQNESRSSTNSTEYQRVLYSLAPSEKLRHSRTIYIPTNRVPAFTEMNSYEKDLFKAKLEQDLLQAG